MTDTASRHISTPDKDKRVTMLVYILFFIGLPTIGLASVAGAIIAHLKCDEVHDPWRSHLDFQIRTFWLALVIGIIGGILTVLLVGWIILAALPLWMIVRCVKGFLAANDNRPIDDPQTLLW